jgi:hypothetical protein
VASYRQILITDARLASLPTSGTAYNNMKSYADGSTVLQRPISLHDNNLETDNAALANAILWRKTGTSSYQDRACNACYDAIGGEDRSGDNPQILPVGRHACNFVLAADIGEMHTWDATKFAAFKTWSNTLRTKQAGSGGGGSIEGVTTNRVNNWAATAWASRIALEIFNDVGGTNLPSAAAVNLIQGWMGDPTKRSNLWPSSGGCWYYGTSPMAGEEVPVRRNDWRQRADDDLRGCLEPLHGLPHELDVPVDRGRADPSFRDDGRDGRPRCLHVRPDPRGQHVHRHEHGDRLTYELYAQARNRHHHQHVRHERRRSRGVRDGEALLVERRRPLLHHRVARGQLQQRRC